MFQGSKGLLMMKKRNRRPVGLQGSGVAWMGNILT